MRGWIVCDPVLHLRMPEEIPQGDQVASDGFAFQLLLVEASQEIHQIVSLHAANFELSLLGKSVKLGQVPSVGAQRVCSQALLNLNVSQKRRNGCRNLHQLSTYASPPRRRRVAIP